MHADWAAAYAAMHAQGEAAFPPACLYYVLEGVRRGARPGPFDAREAEMTPKEIIADFRERAHADFGAFLPEVLADWNLASPADLGEAVLLLGRHGILSLGPGDTREAFAEDTTPLDARPEAGFESGLVSTGTP